MDSKLKVTDVPEESNFYDLVSGDNVLEIPLFQRPYMWKESHYKAFLSDISLIDEDAEAAAFLGVIVTFSRGSGPGRPPTWMVVDGQQRVSTLYLTVLAAVEVAARAGELDWAADVMGRFLLVRPMSGLTTNTKLIPSFNDRAQFAEIWAGLMDVKNFSSHAIVASNPPKPPASSGASLGAMVTQYKRIRGELARLLRDEGLSALDRRNSVVTDKLSVVSISLRDPTVAPKIFERLNYGAEPITVADLVRNEVFARSGDEPEAALHLFQSRWEPFVSRFRDGKADLDKFLFPYGLIGNPNIKMAELFSSLRKRWEKSETPKEIIDDLEQYQPAYNAIMAGADYALGTAKLKESISRLYRSGRPSSILPFAMRLLREFELGNVSEEAASRAVDALESFLFRRAILGIEPTGLHAVFKGLWATLVPDEPSLPYDEYLTPARIKEAIRSKATVTWPNDIEFRNGVISGELYRRKIAAYAVREYEIGLEGESPLDGHQIEHIAPQTPTADWKVKIPKDYDTLVHTWGNLLPLTSSMNPSAGQSKFDVKKKAYAQSIFASARQIANADDWDAASIQKRGVAIADWALQRWPT